MKRPASGEEFAARSSSFTEFCGGDRTRSSLACQVLRSWYGCTHGCGGAAAGNLAGAAVLGKLNPKAGG